MTKIKTIQNGKGKSPEKGRNLEKFWDGYANIEWSDKPKCNCKYFRRQVCDICQGSFGTDCEI